MSGQSSGRQPSDGRFERYDAGDVQAVLGARKRLRISTVSIGDLPPRQLAFHALNTRSKRLRMACVAELLARVEPQEATRVIRLLQVYDGKKHAPKLHDNHSAGEVGSTDPGDAAQGQSNSDSV